MNWDWLADVVAPRLLLILMPVMLIGIPILCVRALRMPSEVKFRKAYQGMSGTAVPKPGFVRIEFHTYDGFLVWCTQTKHEGYFSPDQARRLLMRLAWYNVAYGRLATGGPFVPFLTLFNYLSQRRSIARQLDAFSNDWDINQT
jgi:hypothetical protein